MTSNLKLFVCSRNGAESFTLDDSYCVISITDSNSKYVYRPRNMCIAVRTFRFMDFDLRENMDPDVLIADKPASEWAMTPDQANEVWQFIEYSVNNRVTAFMVHCDAGQSRSPSLVLAVCHSLGVEPKSVSWHGGYPIKNFNRHVYETIMSAYAQRNKPRIA